MGNGVIDRSQGMNHANSSAMCNTAMDIFKLLRAQDKLPRASTSLFTLFQPLPVFPLTFLPHTEHIPTTLKT